jgi:hypothetical protein
MRKANAEPAEGLSSAEAPGPRVAALRAAVNRAESSMFPNSRSSMSARSGGCPELRSTATDGMAGTATGERRDARFTRDFSHRQLAWCPPSRNECLRQRVLTSRAIQRRVFSITSFVIILRRFAHRQPRCARRKACRDSLSASFESSSRAGVWPRDLPVFTATRAATIASFPSRARDGAFARLAAGDAWPNVRHTSLITSCRTLPCANEC